MGTLTGHLLPGAAFTVLGLWHLVNTAASYRISGPSSFSSRFWFPSPFIKHLELLLLLLLSLLSSAILFFLSPSTSPSDLEHASMFLHLFVYSSTALAADLLPSPASSTSIVGALAASAFAQQLLLLHFHSIDHAGLEGHYHQILQIVVAACFVSTAVTVGFPACYVAAVIRSAAVALQGMWFACMGLVLWGPERLLPSGCAVEGATVVCAGGGVAAASAAANVQFSWMVAGVAVITAAVCLVREGNEVEYSKLGNFRGFSGDTGDIGEGKQGQGSFCFICQGKGEVEGESNKKLFQVI